MKVKCIKPFLPFHVGSTYDVVFYRYTSTRSRQRLYRVFLNRPNKYPYVVIPKEFLDKFFRIDVSSLIKYFGDELPF